MARDTEPMTDSELDAFDEATNEQAQAPRPALAQDHGCDPEDHRNQPAAAAVDRSRS